MDLVLSYIIDFYSLSAREALLHLQDGSKVRSDPHLTHRTGFHPRQLCHCRHTCSLHRCLRRGQDGHTPPPWPYIHPDL